MADVYIRHGQIARGLAEYRKAEPFDPEDPDMLVEFGIFCLEREQFSTAETYLQQAKQMGRTNQLEVRAGLGVVYEQLGKTQEAIQEYRAALQIQPDWYEIYLKLSELLKKIGKFIEAADELENLFHLSQRSAHIIPEEDFPDVNQLWSEILRLRGESSKKTVVQFKRSGQYNLVDAVVNQHTPVILLVEKKAKYTILSEKLAQELGIQITSHTSEVHFEVAGRLYSAPLINLPSLKVGGMEVRNIPTLIWNLSDYPGIDGFLGMSFLKHFQVEIKYDEQLFVLTRLYS
jgi:tetratricopeptide (TPR) repeat protein